MAVFATVQGLQKKNDERQQKIDECKERWHKTKGKHVYTVGTVFTLIFFIVRFKNLNAFSDDLWDLWDEKTWCETKDTRDLSECFLGAYNVSKKNLLMQHECAQACGKLPAQGQTTADYCRCLELVPHRGPKIGL